MGEGVCICGSKMGFEGYSLTPTSLEKDHTIINTTHKMMMIITMIKSRENLNVFYATEVMNTLH